MRVRKMRMRRWLTIDIRGDVDFALSAEAVCMFIIALQSIVQMVRR